MVASTSNGRITAPPGASLGIGVMLPRMVRLADGFWGSLVRTGMVASNAPTARLSVLSCTV